MRKTPFICKRFPLPYAKPVLFVRHHQCKVRKNCFFLDQRLRPNHHGIWIYLHILICPSPLPRSKRACQQNHLPFQFKIHTHLHKCLIMLPGQYLRRRHKRRLVAVFPHKRHTKERHHCLARPDIPLYKPLHSRILLQVTDYLIQ